MSSYGDIDKDEQLEDGDLGLGRGCRPGSLPPFLMRRRSRPPNTPQRLPEPSALRDSDETEIVKRPKNPLMMLTSKLGLHSKPKCVSRADDSVHDQSKCDAVVLETSLKQQKLVFQRDMKTIQRRRSIDLQQLGTQGRPILNTRLFSVA